MTEYRDCDIPNIDEELPSEEISVSPESIAFEDTYVWRDSPYHTLTVTNSGNIDWFFGDIITIGDFDITTVSIPNGIKTGKSITVRVIFSPTKVGNLTGSIEFKTLRGASVIIPLEGKSLERKIEDNTDKPDEPEVKEGLNYWTESKVENNSILTPNNSVANVNAVITPKGSGALAGNTKGTNRGKYSVDLQFNNIKSNTVAGGDYSAILSGRNNTALGNYSFIGSGYNNSINGVHSVSITAEDSSIEGDKSFVGTGERTEIIGLGNTILSGSDTVIEGKSNIVGYGYNTNIKGSYNTILTGLTNSIEGLYNTLLCGTNNTITGSANVLGRVEDLNASILNSVILNEDGLSISGTSSNIVINRTNSCSLTDSNNIFIGTTTASYITNTTNGAILLGNQNTLSGENIVILSGSENNLQSDNSIILSGSSNSVNIGSNIAIIYGNSNTISSCNNALIAGADSNISNIDNLIYANNGSLVLSNTTKQNNIITLNTSSGSITDSSNINVINVNELDILSSYSINIIGGGEHYISSSGSLTVLNGHGNTSDESNDSVFLDGYKNKFSSTKRSIALGGSRNVHTAENTVSLGGCFGHDLTISNHVFRALKDGIDFEPKKVDDSTGEILEDNPGNELTDWSNQNSIYQTGSILLQAITETSKGFYENTQEYKRYFLTHALKYLNNNIWTNLPNRKTNNTLLVPEDVMIFWKLDFHLCDFTSARALIGHCLDGIIMNNSEGISVIKTHKSTLETSPAIENNPNTVVPEGEITLEIDKENSKVYFCIPNAWKDFIGGAELSYKLVSKKGREFYWE